MARKQKPLNLDFLSGGSGGADKGNGQEAISPAALPSRSVLSNLLALHKDDAAPTILAEIDRLHDNPYQPRLKADETNLKELALVIKSQGFQGVLVARPHPEISGHYQITAGHRRREASRQAGLSMLPVVVKELSDEEMAGLAITENIQREDLTPLEEGRIFLLMAEEMDYTHEQIAREIGKNRGYVENRLRVARAPEDIQALVSEKPDSLRAVSNLIKVTDPGRRQEAIELLKAGKLTADDLTSFLAGPAPAPASAAAAAQLTPTPQTPVQTGPVETGSGEKDAGGKKLPVSTQKLSEKGKEGEVLPLALERVAASKLATIMRTLQQFGDNVEQRKALSEVEVDQLRRIDAQIRELLKKYYPAGRGAAKD